jgi:FkbH-like protein
VSLDIIEMPWLPALQRDWRDAVKQIAASDTPGMQAQRLASRELDAAQSRLLSRQIVRAIAAGKDMAPLSPLRLAVLSASTFDFVEDAVPAAAARHGVALDCHVAPLDTIEHEAFDPSSGTYAHRPQATLVFTDHRWLGLARAELTGDPSAAVEAAFQRLAAVARALAGNASQTVILTTAAIPPGSLFGSLDGAVTGSVRALVMAFNARLPSLVSEIGGVVLDVASLAEQVGTARWFHAQSYHLYKLPFLPAGVPLFADWLGRLVGALCGKARKCLVLDLDNTCWGGVIGDDGLDGIRLGPGSSEGESFVAVQQAALALRARGVMLAVASKNNDAIARAAFRDHPEMVLRETDIAVFQANWNDKPSNLEAIAQALSIGIDSLVFLDDNAAERAQMRAALPAVTVPELPADPAHYPAMLLAAGYFEAVSFSDEDRDRAAGYQANTERVAVRSRVRDLGDYLSALQMEIGHAPVDSIGRARIAQLINKSNQFNRPRAAMLRQRSPDWRQNPEFSRSRRGCRTDTETSV